MMNHVVHTHAANAGDLRQRKDFLAAGEELPALHHVGIADASEGGARLGDLFVERGEKFCAIGDLRRLVARAVHRRVV